MTKQLTTLEQELELLTPPPTSSSFSGRVGISAATLLYSADGHYVFQCQAHVVRVLYAKSGHVLHECTRTTTPSPVCALALHPHNSLQLLVAYQDGYIVVWDFVEQKSLVEINTNTPVLWMASSFTSPSQLLLIIKSDENKWCLVEFSLKKKKCGRILFQCGKPIRAAALQSYSISQCEGSNHQNAVPGDYVVLAAGRSIITGWLHYKPGAKDSNNRVYVQKKFKHLRQVTSVAVNPIQPKFSIGDQTGQIFLYDHHGVAGKHKAPTAMMHWHSHAVHCIQYSNDGRLLLSGGEECVLVTWHLETGRRAYLPRLPAPIEVIAPHKDGGVYVVGLEDNVLFQYNLVTREQEWEARGLARGGRSAADSLPTRQLIVDPLSKALVMNGSSGAGVLQFYEPFADHVLQTLLLSDRNQVTRTEDEVLPTLLASHSCFSLRGGDLVTLHAPSTMKKKGNEQALRFWTRRVDGSFFVNTAVDAPHGRGRVMSITFSPVVDSDCVVTADDEGDFKVWQKSVTEAGGVSWHCQAVVRFRDEPITAVGFARDGSLLAVAYGNKLTLWDVTSHSLRRVLPSADGQKIKQIVFPGISSPFIVVVTNSQVQVWSLLSLSLWWRYTVPKSTVVAEETLHERFLVWMPVNESSKKRTLVLVFDPQTPVPLCVRVINLGRKVWSAGFHPGTGDIIFVDNKTGIWRLDGPYARSLDARRRKHAHVTAIAARVASKNGEQETKALSAIYNAANGDHVSQNKAKQSSHFGQSSTTGNGSSASSLFDAPAHVLPSMTSLYRPFMDTMLPKPHKVAESGSQTKRNKRFKKQLQQQQQTPVDFSANENTEQRKRMKLQVEKDLANPELQQQTYSKLLETFRNTKARRA